MKINGATVLLPTVFNPSELRSDVTGKVVRFLQQDGEQVEKDQPFVEVEAMKMIMAIKATESGVIKHSLSPGSILSAGDLIASLKLKDPSKVKQISSFDGRLITVSSSSLSMTVDEAKERLGLVIDGYEHDAAAALNTYLAGTPLKDVYEFFGSLLAKYLAVESVFDDKDESGVIGALCKTNKDKIDTLVPTLVARKQIKSRTAAVLSVIRQIETFPEKFRDFKSVEIPTSLSSAFNALASLKSPVFGEVNLKAKQIIDDNLMPPFQKRLDDLKASLLASSADLKSLANLPNLAVSVDLLTALFKDPDAKVRANAVETYLRRVYRASCIKTLDISEKNGVLTAAWTFSARETVDGPSPVRSGFFAMLNSFDDIERSLPGIAAEAAAFLPAAKTSNSEPLNVFHVGFGKLSGSESSAAVTAEKAVTSLLSQLKALDVRSVNVLLVNPEKRPSYFNYYASTGFKEDVVMRNMRPTMPVLLELNRLLQNYNLESMPTVSRNSQMYLGTERGKAAKDSPQVLYLRSISLEPRTVSDQGAERVMLMAMDELERATLDSRVSDTVLAQC